jgi:hypothetical protein
MTTWVLDVTLGHDPVWVPVGQYPDGTVGAFATSAFVRLEIGQKPEGVVHGIWHQDGGIALQAWLASPDATPWREFLGC